MTFTGLATSLARSYVSQMRTTRRSGIALATTLVCLLATGSGLAHAQAQGQNPVYVPGQPAPVPPPPPTPSNPPLPNAPPKLDTFGDKVIRCQHYAGTIGLPPGQIDTYVRGCANN